VFFRAIHTETVPNVTGHHFFDIFLPKLFFDNNEFFSVIHSCCCLTGLRLGIGCGLGLNLLVLFPSLLGRVENHVKMVLKNTANFCENHKNHGKDTASNRGPEDHYTVQSIKLNI